MNTTHFDAHISQMGGLTLWNRENAADNSEFLEHLRKNLRRARLHELTPRQQEVLTLYYEKSLTVSQIAVLLHVNRSTVSRTLQRATKNLRRCLQYML